MFTYIIYGLAVIGLSVSFFKDRQKNENGFNESMEVF